MMLRPLAAAMSLFLAMTTTGSAATMDFEFSLSPNIHPYTHLEKRRVSGSIQGLESHGAHQEIDRIVLIGVLDIYVITTASTNMFNVQNSVLEISMSEFSGHGHGVTNSASTASIQIGKAVSYSHFAIDIVEHSNEMDVLLIHEFSVARLNAVPPMTPVPLPAGGLLLLSGLGGLVALNRRKKRAS